MSVSGTPYDMGYAHGVLMKEKAQSMMNDVWKYLEDQVVCVYMWYNHKIMCMQFVQVMLH